MDQGYEQMVTDWKKIIDYGPRPIGSENMKACSDYVWSVIQEITGNAQKDSYPYTAWDVREFALEEVREGENRKIPAYVFLNSGASEGFRGKVRYAGHNRVWDMYVWDRYGIVDETGEIRAYVTIRTNDEAIPQMLFQGRSDVPHFLVGEEERSFFEAAEENGTEITGFADTFLKENCSCINVVGTLPRNAGGAAAGEDGGNGNDPSGTPKIVICGHCDTVYNTQGAYDNSAGTAVVLELGRRLKEYQRNCEIELLITDGEEFDLVGARKRYEKCKEEDIRFVLNLDGVGRDKLLEVWSGPEPLERKIRKCLDKSPEEFAAIYKCPPPPGSDHAPYFAGGIPVCMLTFNDQGILHSPKDVYRESLIENMEVMVRISLDLLGQLKVIESK